MFIWKTKTMKKIYFRALVVPAMCMALLGCSKEERSSTNNPQKVSVDKAAVASETIDFSNHTVVPGKPGGKFPAMLLEYYELEDHTRYPYTAINTVTPEYLAETCPFDLSQLEDGKSYKQIDNKNLKMQFHVNSQNTSPVVKISSVAAPAFGWTAAWGTYPNVQQGNPQHLIYTYNDKDFVILLSKPCIEFGFEIAPNSQGKEYGYGVSFGNAKFDDNRGSGGARVTTPLGAKLIAVKATQPFNTINITYSKQTGTDLGSSGIALANIRYKLAK